MEITRKEFIKVGLASLVASLGIRNFTLEPDNIPVEVSSNEVSVEKETNNPKEDGKWHVLIKNPSGMLIDLEALDFSLETRWDDLDILSRERLSGITIPTTRSWTLTVKGTNGIITQELFKEK